MLSLWQNVLLFLPLNLVINLVAAVPGRRDLREVWRVGLRHFVIGSIVMVVGSALLYFLVDALLARAPLW